jgi:hypothetical protein
MTSAHLGGCARWTLGIVGVLALAFSVACASVELPREQTAFVDDSGLFAIDLGPAFRQVPARSVPFDAAFRASGGLTVAVLTSRPARSLDEMDARVASRILSRADDGRIIDVKDAVLGGLPARATHAYSTFEGVPLHTVNLHTATVDETLEIVIWAPAARAHEVRAVVDNLQRRAFRFVRDVLAFDTAVPDLEELPVAFQTLPPGWEPLARGELNPAAAVELSDGDGLFLIGIIEESGQIPFPAMQAIVEERLAQLLSHGTDTEPNRAFAEEGEAPDMVWSQRGLLSDGEALKVTYRVRLVEESGRFLHLYCWGDGDRRDLTERCDQTLKAARLR